jgi:hypothetical protein
MKIIPRSNDFKNDPLKSWIKLGFFVGLAVGILSLIVMAVLMPMQFIGVLIDPLPYLLLIVGLILCAAVPFFFIGAIIGTIVKTRKKYLSKKP